MAKRPATAKKTLSAANLQTLGAERLAGRLADAWLVERGTMPGQRVLPLVEMTEGDAPYFAIVLVHGQGRRPEFEPE